MVEALSHSRFWGQTAVFAVEDDAQNGPDHVDAHRTEALVAGPFVRRGRGFDPLHDLLDAATIELILGLEPMSQFDAAADPMRASFQAVPAASPFQALEESVDIGQMNPRKGRWPTSRPALTFSREDRVDEQAFNRVIWSAVRGEGRACPAPVHAAFVRQLPGPDDD